MQTQAPIPLATAGAQAIFQRALSLHQQGLIGQADAACAEVLQADPRHYAAWHLRGLLAISAGRLTDGVELLHRSLAIAPTQPAAQSNLGNALLDLGRADEALPYFSAALRLTPGYLPALYNRGNALRTLGRLSEALESYDEVLQQQSNHAQAHNNRGLALLALGRAVEALEAFQSATRADPGLFQAHRNYVGALIELGRAAEGLSYLEPLLTRLPAHAELLCARGDALLALHRPRHGIEAYSDALRLNPRLSAAWIGRGYGHQALREMRAAQADYDAALAIEPDSASVLKQIAAALLAQGLSAAALDRYERALQRTPQDPDALLGRACAWRELRRFNEAIRGFAQASSSGLTPMQRGAALGGLFETELSCCAWQDYEPRGGAMSEFLMQQRTLTNPLISFLLPIDPELQHACAMGFVEKKFPPRAQPIVSAAVGKRIRLAYVSADFCEHPVAELLAGVLDRHDRDRFELIGVSLQAAPGSPMRARLQGACHRFIEAEQLSDEQIALQLRELGVDIALDLMGFTQGMRLGIFAHRAAPVQVNYLGYAGTLGAPYMDYILADEVVIPQGQEAHYSEQVVRLPHCYLPNDDRREIGERPSRSMVGLPEGALVLCAFTNTYKINPPMYEVWMRLLRELPESVLWLRAVGEPARGNLLREAQRRGVEPERLIFAEHVSSMSEHLGRQALADLYLDTVPYNAHSTACDALWAGVPVLSCAGRSFASRVAASALQAVGLAELVTESLQQYERVALELGRERPRLAALRARLAAHRLGAPLFDTRSYTRALESALHHMHQRARLGLPPAGFNVGTNP